MLTRIATTASAMMMLLSVQAGAAAPQLPPNAVGPQTTVVSYMDGASFTPDAMRQAARAVLGPNSPSLAQLNQQIAKYQEQYDKATKAGVQSLMVIANTSAQRNPGGANAAAPEGMKEQAATWVQLKPGADSAAVEKMIREEMKPADQEKNVFERQGNFLVVHEKDQKLPAASDADRAKQFIEALSHAANAAVVVAFIPDQATRDQAKNQQNNANTPKWIADAMPVLSNSKWGTLAVSFGQSPAITVTVQTADDQSAKTLATSINAGLAQLRQLAQNPNQGPGAGGPMAMFAPMLAPLADALKPNQQGSTVTVQLNGPALAMIAETAANLAPVFMGGNGQGQGNPGARRGR